MQTFNRNNTVQVRTIVCVKTIIFFKELPFRIREPMMILLSGRNVLQRVVLVPRVALLSMVFRSAHTSIAVHAYQSLMSSASAINHLIDHPGFQAFCKRECSYVCIPNAFANDPNLLADLKIDATCLKQNGFGASAGIASNGHNGNIKKITDVASKTEPTKQLPQEIRRGVHQIWLSSPSDSDSSSNPLQNVFCGRIDARQSLLRQMQQLTCAIQQTASVSVAIGGNGETDNKYTMLNPAIPPELSYLLYEPGSYYQKHVDLIQKRKKGTDREHERVVSMILYLGHDQDEERAYDQTRDGGSLRIYGGDNDAKNGAAYDVQAFQDILPLPNTLVLMDSATVSHEVLETLSRSRICVVGWFHGVPSSLLSTV